MAHSEFGVLLRGKRAAVDDAIGELSAEALIRLGGWHPAYARVLLIEHDGDRALVLIDGNGDGAELELEYWSRDSDGLWRGGSSSGHGSLDGMPRSQSWNAGEFVAALGRVEHGATLSLVYGRQIYLGRASETGVWGFIHAADSPRPDDLPALIAVVSARTNEAPRSQNAEA
jgi:hypothetical protein